MPLRIRIEPGSGTKPHSTPESLDRRAHRPVEQRILIAIPFSE